MFELILSYSDSVLLRSLAFRFNEMIMYVRSPFWSLPGPITC